jgi:UDP-3-O-[3-hydroxymyristoyl] glucosamine N-acyltransferase
VPDARFFEAAGPLSLTDVAALAGVETPSSDDRPIETAAPLVRADGRSVSFLSDKRYLADLEATQAAAVFVTAAFAPRVPTGTAALVTPIPQVAWARVAARLHRPRRLEAGPAVHPDARLEEAVVLAPGAVIGAGVRIGRGTHVGANTVVGPGVAIGRDCRIGDNVSIGFALIGDRVQILSGAVIGESGFGVAGGAEGAVDVPQLGRVILQDGVTIGANSCVDRGAFDDTVVGENSKIDNLVQVAHNVRLGRSCVLAGFVGLSGSSIVGDGVMFGGRAGVADHLRIGDGARIAANAGVMRDVDAGETVAGFPARPIREWLRESAWLTKRASGRPGRGES